MTDFGSIEQSLRESLGPELTELVALVVNGTNKYGAQLVQLPTQDTAELSVVELGQLVAETSNSYSTICRLSGCARALYKLAERAHERVYKANLKEGKTQNERIANATAAAEKHSEELGVLEGIVELADAYVNAARVASESARKLMGLAEQRTHGESRAMTAQEKSNW